MGAPLTQQLTQVRLDQRTENNRGWLANSDFLLNGAHQPLDLAGRIHERETMGVHMKSPETETADFRH